MSEIVGEIVSWVALFIVVLILYVTKLFWDRLNKRVQQSLFGAWYRKRPRNWRVTVAITAIVSLLSLFWCVCGFGIIGLLDGVLWVIVSSPIIGFLILGACWSISEGLEGEGLSKQTLKVGIPSIAVGILILFGAILILGILTLLQIAVITVIALGTTFFLTLFFFMRSDFSLLRKREKPEAWELKDRLKGLDEQLSLGHITQKEYEKRREKLLERPPELKGQLEYKQKKELREEQIEGLEEQGYNSASAAVASELEGQLAELKKQMLAGAIDLMEYEHKKRKLLEELTRLKKMLIAGVINLREYKQEKKKLLENLNRNYVSYDYRN